MKVLPLLCGAAGLSLAAFSVQAAAPAACPALHEQLPELLASSLQRQGRPAELRAEFEVDAQGRVQPGAVQGDRRYMSPVRIALRGLDCHGGQPQRYVLRILFAATPQPGPALALAQAH